MTISAYVTLPVPLLKIPVNAKTVSGPIQMKFSSGADSTGNYIWLPYCRKLLFTFEFYDITEAGLS